MNNWDSRPKIVVAIVGDNVSPELFDLAVKSIAKDEGMTGDITKEEYNGNTYYLIASGSLDPSHIDTAMGCLYDHVANIDMGEHDGNLWGGCVLADHVENDIECHSAHDDCNYVNVGSFEYWGPNIVVDTYYITE
jgi:hypothetical protein